MIVVVGSLNMDMTVRTGRAPGPGETLLGKSFMLSPGGKGGNQAVAAARLGGEVTMIGCVGQDAFGREMLEVMRGEHIDTRHIAELAEQSTGVASIVVEEDGENRIIVVPGANLALSAEDIAGMEPVISEAEVLVLQLEMDLNMVEHAAEIAHRHGVPVILNPAPARELGAGLLSLVTILTPNETEAGILSGITVDSVDSAREAAGILLQKGVQHVIMTLGPKGALIVNKNGAVHVPGFPVQPVDTVAAGDSFNGALAVQLAKGRTLEEAVVFANAVGALAVGKAGAVASLPYLEEVERFLEESVQSRGKH